MLTFFTAGVLVTRWLVDDEYFQFNYADTCLIIENFLDFFKIFFKKRNVNVKYLVWNLLTFHEVVSCA